MTPTLGGATVVFVLALFGDDFLAFDFGFDLALGFALTLALAAFLGFDFLAALAFIFFADFFFMAASFPNGVRSKNSTTMMPLCQKELFNQMYAVAPKPSDFEPK